MVSAWISFDKPSGITIACPGNAAKAGGLTRMLASARIIPRVSSSMASSGCGEGESLALGAPVFSEIPSVFWVASGLLWPSSARRARAGSIKVATADTTRDVRISGLRFHLEATAKEGFPLSLSRVGPAMQADTG